ncbi:hypothetical protein [Photobacterium lipolyticum]|uniref:Uncharacterized protein n=1 Tax=Photobacterium lipolyticum TaxID=266810 RepID=A0A2T3MS79_9GAMM|nr:hypothetical protein [Photobacterium lipolyticum]PSW00130.1 hypothetical protein C9I89_21420 [Photobacterium lipolyticum]
MKKNKPGAPGWVFPVAIIVLMTMQLSLKTEDVRAHQIDTIYGETLALVDEKMSDEPYWHELSRSEQNSYEPYRYF